MTLLKEMNFDSLEMPNERLESTYIQQGETTLSNNIEEKYSNKSFPLKNTTVGDLSTPHRELVDIIEIVYLSVIIVVGTVLNLIVLVRFMRQKRIPRTGNNSNGTSPFNLFKINLAVTDFAILLIHALGKMIWLLTYQWKFGAYGCKLYQFGSAFTYYSNSNVIMAIGIDRLKVVYSFTHTSQSMRINSIIRVRRLLAVAWISAFICALPQLFFWTNIELQPNWFQCTTKWAISEHMNTFTTEEKHIQVLYEMLHQAMVFWLPFVSLFFCYVLIVIKVLSHTVQPRSFPSILVSKCKMRPKCEESMDSAVLTCPNHTPTNKSINFPDELSQSTEHVSKTRNESRRFSSLHLNEGRMTKPSSERTFQRRLYKSCSNIWNLLMSTTRGSNHQIDSDVIESSIIVDNGINSRSMTPRRKSDDERRNTFIKIATNGNNTMNEIKRHRFVFKSVLSGSRRRYRNSRPSMRSLACSRGLSVTSSASSGAPPVASRCARCSVCSSVGNRVQQKTGGTVSRIQSQWHKQVRSKVFVTSLLIVTLHCVFWLPYNLLNSLRYIDEQFYSKLVDNGGLLVEDLIVLNSLVNPLFYGH